MHIAFEWLQHWCILWISQSHESTICCHQVDEGPLKLSRLTHLLLLNQRQILRVAFCILCRFHILQQHCQWCCLFHRLFFQHWWSTSLDCWQMHIRTACVASTLVWFCGLSQDLPLVLVLLVLLLLYGGSLQDYFDMCQCSNAHL